MTISSFTLYALLSFSKLRVLFGLIAVASALATSFTGVMCVTSTIDPYPSEERQINRCKKFFKMSAIACLGSAILACLIPTKTEMAAIAVIPAIVNSEAAQTIPADITALAKEWLEELKPNKK